MSELIRESHGPVAYLRLNRPEARNALSLALIIALTEAVAALAADPTVRVIVLAGSGHHFCAGADLGWMRAGADLDAAASRREAATLERLFATIDTAPQAIVGDVSGAAIGGGAGLVAVCDYVLATDDAFFRFSEVTLGLIPAVIAPYVLAKLGPSATRAYFTNGERFDAARARELGLVHEIVLASEHDAALARIVDRYLTCAPGAVAAAKALLATLVHDSASAEGVAAFTAEAIAERRMTEEARQGLTAFFAQSKPPWHP